MAMMLGLFKWLSLRLPALVWRGSSIRTADYEIHAPTTDGVLTLMRELRHMPPARPLLPTGKHDSLPDTVQAEEPMTVKG